MWSDFSKCSASVLTHPKRNEKIKEEGNGESRAKFMALGYAFI